MKEKVKIGLLLLLVLCAVLVIDYFSSYAFDLIALTFALIATTEYARLQLKSGMPCFKWVPQIATALIFITAVIGYLCSANAITILLIELLVVGLLYLTIFVGSAFVLKEDTSKDEFRQAVGMSTTRFAFFKSNNTLLAILYPGVMLLFVSMLNHCQSLGFVSFSANTEGVNMGLIGIILVFAICCMSDTFAMLFGTWIKGKKLCPKVSPHKTISGAIFGVFGGILGAMLVYFIGGAIYKTVFAHVAWWEFIVVGFMGSVVAQLGDIFESAVKRKAGEKDSGDLFRSHGGVLDRLDSVIFATPYIFICLLFMFG
ncbi:MAG: phosphatidate cytidylyltransferase [Christensenellales bacterium]